MASYFDEHNCEALGPGEQPPRTLNLARLLLGAGLTDDFLRLLEESDSPPPASKEFIKNLEAKKVEKPGGSCPICLSAYEIGSTITPLPCKHDFHTQCILPWLEKASSCPVCRIELPTDDPEYEEFKKIREFQKQREGDLENLHNSMFS